MKFTSALIYTAFLFIIVFILHGCKGANGNDKTVIKDSVPLAKKDITIPGNFSNQRTLTFDSSQLTIFLKQYPLLSPLRKDLDSFYSSRKYAFAWFDKSGLIEQAANLYNRVQNLSDEGLTRTIPYSQQFTELMKNNGMDSLNTASEFAELMLTSQYFLYAQNVWAGLDDKQILSLNWYLPRKKVSYSQLLDSLIQGKDILDTAPVYRQYGLLKNYLKRYKEIESKGGFPVIKADKKTYKKGDSSAAILSMRQLLLLTGDLGNNNNSVVFDDELETAVKSFQHRNGDKEDGVAGPYVLKEMNTPVETRIQQIIVNMERSRWVPVNLVSDYLVINIPEYKLHVYEKDSLVWSMNVVVGQPAYKTVIFNGDIKYVVFSPYWNVPSGILRKEVLPGIKRDKNYLAKHNMEWNGNTVRQKPGLNNSLGLVKFLFPNSYDIYLHDTPAKSLFGESTRAFSHGCIRLAEPTKLAEYLLRNDAAWNPDKIDKAMHAGKEKFVTLSKPIPVFIAYFTSWVDRQGNLNFRNDVYGRDSRLAEMLLDKPSL